MPHYAYIDESGTMDHQDVMTVAAVVFEGAHSAAKLHDHVMRALIPKYGQLLRQLNKGRQKGSKRPRMHFTDMDDANKSVVADLVRTAKLTVFTASYWYESLSLSHDTRFCIYTELVK